MFLEYPLSLPTNLPCTQIYRLPISAKAKAQALYSTYTFQNKETNKINNRNYSYVQNISSTSTEEFQHVLEEMPHNAILSTSTPDV